ncbi:MAG: type II toxin-antitoxin system HicB family antitoxin [Candidatus Yonathbacteria bacterium]|nr:type II toxin-antitoxin system HicB family antitoxin [Candidatus Yonathbacteria bacterium]
MTSSYPIIIEKTEDGYYAECPFIQGVYAQGETEEEVRSNLKDVLKMTLEDVKSRGERVDLKDSFSLAISSLTVSA